MRQPDAGAVSDVRLRNTLPESAVVSGVRASQGRCTRANTDLACRFGDLAAGASKDFQLACLTYEPFPSFVLARKQTGFAGRFFLNLLESDVFMVEVPSEQAFRYEEKQFVRQDGRKRRIPSFAG